MYAPVKSRLNETLLFSNNKTTSSAIGVDVDAAYAFSDWFMMTLGGYYKSETDINTTNDILDIWAESKINYQRKAFNIGAGALIPLTHSKRFLFNPIVGVRIGKSDSKMYNISDSVSDNRRFYLDGNFTEFYLSPNFNIELHRNHKINLNPQIALSSCRNTHTNYPDKVVSFLNISVIDGTHVFFSPSIFYQIGFDEIDWLKIDLGVTFSSRLNNNDNFRYLKTRSFHFSAGTSFNL